MDLEEIIEKWETLGLLNELPEHIKINTALSYEKATEILLNDEISLTDEFLVNNLMFTAIFPVIYRISKTGLNIKNIHDLIKKFNQFLIDNRGILTHSTYNSPIDVEAELCRIFAEDYGEWIKNNSEINPIKYIPKHKL